ncbi:MAG: type I DNA topoisomerase [Bryobacterales bacterium]|nr:type I DNA topoisomerase [Bryobacterales bacterium]
MSTKNLVIVESPTKARTISKFLAKDYDVVASNGHIRDLPNNAAEIPTNLKKESWARLGVNIDDQFEALYVVPKDKKDHVKLLKEKLKDASTVYLATDEDREGESISWHLVQTLKPKVPVHRMVFHEITKDAILEALANPRSIDENLVKAQETRRIVDRLYGYEVSPLLWKKMAPGLSAGRVQSVAVRLLVERERQRIRFRKAGYWALKAKLRYANGDPASEFEADLTHVGERRIATGKDFDPTTGQLAPSSNLLRLEAEQALALQRRLEAGNPLVEQVEEKPFVSKPSAPFVTSTLQQESNRKLRLSARRTMTVAQQLYENGFITYMRTDSTTLSEEALRAARQLIARDFGKEYLPAEPRKYITKVKNAQEAHEAIRPAGNAFVAPDVVRAQLGEEAFRLYQLIWQRTVACQMADARGTYVNVTVAEGELKLRAAGKTIEFPGYLRAYVEGADDPDAELADQERVLPKMTAGQPLRSQQVEAQEKITQAAPRYTEGSLIKELERLGIGRPSTWATIVELVLSRSYAFKKGTALVPTFVAMAVVGLLEEHFQKLLDYQFTAKLEDDLDEISRGESANKEYLQHFYFGRDFPGLKGLVESGEKSIDPRIACRFVPASRPEDSTYEVRIGRYGPFLTDGERRAGLPEDMAPDELTPERAAELLSHAATGDEPIGKHPETGEPVYLKAGRFGPYVQLGDGGEDKKPKMASLLPGMKKESVDLDQALALLALPRTVGLHPETGEEVIASNGRFGPFVKSGAETRSIPMDRLSPLTITLEDAMVLLKEPKFRGRASAKPEPLREIGTIPGTEKKVTVMTGRYGPYVTDGEVNATIPKGAKPESVSLEEAMQLIADRAAKIAAEGGTQRRGGRKGAAKKVAAKKAPAKKAAKKAAAKKAVKVAVPG